MNLFKDEDLIKVDLKIDLKVNPEIDLKVNLQLSLEYYFHKHK